MCPVDCRLFGHPTRAKILAHLACLGPMTVRELSRAVEADASGVWVSIDKFIAAGFVLKNERPGFRKRVSLDRSHPAYAELRDLLRRIGRRFGLSVQPTKRAGCGSLRALVSERRAVDLQTLFGSQNRGALMLLALERGDVDREDVSELLSISKYGAQTAINSLVAEGVIVVREREGLRRPISLDEGYVAHAELAALLERVLHLAPEYRSIAEASRREIGGHRGPKMPKVERTRVRNPLKRATRALAFFETGAARALVLLSTTNAPVRVADLAAHAGIEISSVRRSLRLLERAGLLALRVAPTEKGVDGWAYLRRDDSTRSLVELAKAVGRANGVERIESGRRSIPSDPGLFSHRPDYGSLARGARLRVLAAIASGPDLGIGAISAALGIARRSVRLNMDFLDRAFLIQRGLSGDGPLARLHPKHDAKAELARFLKETGPSL